MNSFKFTYNDCLDEALLDGYDQNKDFFKLLLDNDEMKARIMNIFMEDVYESLKK